MNLKELKDEELEEIAKQIIDIKRERTIDFFKAIKENDINKLKNIVDLGIDCEQSSFIDRIYSINAIESVDAIDFLLKTNISNKELDKTKIKDRSLTIRNEKINSSKARTYGELFNEFLIDRIISGFNFSEINNDFFKKYIKLIENKTNINIILERLIKKIDLTIFPDVYKYMEENNKIYLIEKTLNHKTVNLMMEKQKNTESNIKNNIDYVKIMKNAISSGSLEVIEELKKNNIAIYDESYDKNIYSELFLKTNASFKECQMYVLKNIENINAHNNLILRCIFHVYEKGNCEAERQKDLVTEILISTPKENLDELEKNMKDRKQSNLKTFLENSIYLKRGYNVRKKVV